MKHPLVMTGFALTAISFVIIGIAPDSAICGYAVISAFAGVGAVALGLMERVKG